MPRRTQHERFLDQQRLRRERGEAARVRAEESGFIGVAELPDATNVSVRVVSMASDRDIEPFWPPDGSRSIAVAEYVEQVQAHLGNVLSLFRSRFEITGVWLEDIDMGRFPELPPKSLWDHIRE